MNKKSRSFNQFSLIGRIGWTVATKKKPIAIAMGFSKKGDPYGTRTRVTAVKGRCPRPLDEGAMMMWTLDATHHWSEF